MEGTFATQYGHGDPKAAGDALGLSTEPVRGAREKPNGTAFSMHLFGLAIDLDYTQNPWVSAFFDWVFGRAGTRTIGEPAKWEKGASWAHLDTLDKLVETHFGLLDDDAQLTRRLTTATGSWESLAVAKI